MKKILTLVTLVVLSLSSVQAQNNGKMNGQNNAKAKMNQKALKHANPMPNLMRVAMKNKDVLKLDNKQIKALKAWSNEKKPQMKQLIKKVMKQERALREEALTTDKQIMKKANNMLDTRKAIIKMKTACRRNLKTILTPAQYEHVVSIYRTKMAKNQSKK